MSNYMDEAKAMRASIAGLAEGASDEKIIDNKSAFPFWKHIPPQMIMLMGIVRLM